jgi:hypothetical protein
MMTDQYRPGEVGIEKVGIDGNEDPVGSNIWLSLGLGLGLE